MSRPFYLILFIGFLIQTVSAQCPSSTQAPATEWQQNYEGYSVWTTALQQTPDGGFVSLKSNGNAGSQYQTFVVKTAMDGSSQWEAPVSVGIYNDANSLALAGDGGYVVAGNNSADGAPGYGLTEGYVVKMNTAGTIEWKRLYGSEGRDEIFSIVSTSDGGYIMAGSTEAGDGGVLTIHGYLDYWVVKLDASGNVQWQKVYGGSDGDDAFCIQQTKDGGYVVAGRTASSDGIATGAGGYVDCMILKLDASGNIVWTTLYGAKAQDRATSIYQCPDGGYIVGANVDYDDSFTPFLFGKNALLKLSSGGQIEWATILQGSGEDDSYRTDVKPAADGGYILVGTTCLNVNADHRETFYDAYVAKTDASGKLLWEQTYGSADIYDAAQAVVVTTDGGYAISGTSFSNNNGVLLQHSWLLKLAPDLAQKPRIDSIRTTRSCFGGPDGTAQIFATGASPLTYTLNGSGSNSNSTGVFTSVMAGNYTARVANAGGCDTTTSLTVARIESPMVSAYGTAPACQTAANGSIKFYIDGPEPPYLNSFNSSAYTYTNVYGGLKAADYTLIVKDRNGCIEHFQFSVPASENECTDPVPAEPPVTDSVVFVSIPSAFSPNGDGRNDRFYPVIKGAPAAVKLAIYNRFGQILYESNEQSTKGWDGTLHGALQPTGVYLYHLVWKTAGKTSGEKSGTVTLIR